MGRRRVTFLATVCAVAAAVGIVAAGSAQAFPLHGGDPETGSAVTQLRLDHGNGTIDLLVRARTDDSLNSIDVAIPASGGIWTVRSITENGIDCTVGAGPGLLYACATPTGDDLPYGDYTLHLPVSRSGAFAGLEGSVTTHRSPGTATAPNDGVDDTFPILDRTGGLTQPAGAEVWNLNMLGVDPGVAGNGRVYLTVANPADAPLWTVDVSLPSRPGVTWDPKPVTAVHGPNCESTSPDGPSGPALISCDYVGAHGQRTAFPAETHTVTIRIDSVGRSDGLTGTVSGQTVSGGAFSLLDTFPIYRDIGLF
jgi:hypothetical protein